MRAALLGHRVIAIEGWRVREVNYDRVLGGILSREATKKRGAHVDTGRDELGSVTGQRWELLMGSLEQVGDSRC